ncbi:DUF397 domain-containing protein [Streptomyces sp. LBUM 1485]|nr:DUF397 domain-containing protein [Streptomyces sp. LBUM 1485]
MRNENPNGADSLVWVKSSYSGDNSNCVEVAALQRGHAVRDSKNPNGPMLAFTAEEWGAFISGAKSGEFDA